MSAILNSEPIPTDPIPIPEPIPQPQPQPDPPTDPEFPPIMDPPPHRTYKKRACCQQHALNPSSTYLI